MMMLLQSRLSSSRLPGKALLPLGGRAMMILAAKRASNRGGALRVITSTHASDDILAATAREAGFPVVRGALDDVLARTIAATADLADDAIGVRLTGDNCLPDQTLVETTVARLVSTGADYAAARWPVCDLPYGLAVEAFRIGALRLAHAHATSVFDRENTTPWLRRNVRCALVESHAGSGFARLRCTVDSLDEYLDMRRLFDASPDPIGETWESLVRRLADDPVSPAAFLPAREYFGVWGDDPDAIRVSSVVIDASASAVAAGPASVPALRAGIGRGVTHFVVSSDARVANRIVGRALAGGWSSRVGIVARIDASDGCAVERAALELCRDLGVARFDGLLLPGTAGADSFAAAEGLRMAGIAVRLGLVGAHAAPAGFTPGWTLDRPTSPPGIPALGGMAHRVDSAAI